MFFKKRNQKEIIEDNKPLFLGKPFSFWIEIDSKLQMSNIDNILAVCIEENIEFKIENEALQKENETLRIENEALEKALNKFIKKVTKND